MGVKKYSDAELKEIWDFFSKKSGNISIKDLATIFRVNTSTANKAVNMGLYKQFKNDKTKTKSTRTRTSGKNDHK